MSTVILRYKTRHHDTVRLVADIETAKTMAREWVGTPLPESGHRAAVEREVSQAGGLVTGWWCERHNDFGQRRASIMILNGDNSAEVL